MWRVFLVVFSILRVMSAPCPLLSEPRFPYQTEYLISE